MKRRTVVVSGFPGVGKSFLFERGELSALDSDSSKFSWKDEPGGERHPEWPDHYIRHVQANLGEVDVIFVSSHPEVRAGLVAAGVEFVLVYPGLGMKDEYMERYRQRGNQENFLGLLDKFWETWIPALIEQEHCRHVVLGPGQYLSDVINAVLAE